MNGKERGLAPFEGKVCDRFPMWYGGAPVTTQNIIEELNAKDEEEAFYQKLQIDYKTIRPRYMGKPLQSFLDGTRMSEMGIRRGGLHYGQAVENPLANAQCIADLERYSWPNLNDWDCEITVDQREWAKDSCLIGGAWAPYFHDVVDLVGMEELFIMMYDDPAMVDCMIEHIFEFYCELNRRTFAQNPGVVDFYFMGNDFGSQRALLMSPDMWRRFFKPTMRKFMDRAHSAGCRTGIHSCGDIHEIIPDLIEIGVEAINPIQVGARNMDPTVLKREYGGDCVFFGGIDENVILAKCDEETVRAETRRIIDILGSDGRYIVAASHDYLLPEIPARNIVAMFDEAKHYGTP